MAIHTVGVTTRYLAPTTHRGSRIKVTVAGYSKTVSYDHGAYDEHAQAVADSWEHFRKNMFPWCTKVSACDYVTSSESGNGKVFLVTYESGE